MKWNERSYGFKIADNYPNKLRFADDIVLIAKDHQELQAMVKKLHAERGRVGLKMNTTKTETQFANTTTQSNIVVDNESLDKVDQYIYLGQNIHANGGQQKEVRRVAMTWGKFGKTQSISTKSKIPTRLKEKDFHAVLC